MTKKTIEYIDVNNIPTKGLHQYSKDELLHIARYALQRLDIKLLKMRWELIEKDTNRERLRNIINTLNKI